MSLDELKKLLEERVKTAKKLKEIDSQIGQMLLELTGSEPDELLDMLSELRSYLIDLKLERQKQRLFIPASQVLFKATQDCSGASTYLRIPGDEDDDC